MNILLEITDNTTVTNPYIVVVTGILVVFLGMILITALLYLSNFISRISEKIRSKSKKNIIQPEDNKDPEIAENSGNAENGTDALSSEDEELVAVISAAIAAYYSETGHTPTVRAANVKRICRSVVSERRGS